MWKLYLQNYDDLQSRNEVSLLFSEFVIKVSSPIINICNGRKIIFSALRWLRICQSFPKARTTAEQMKAHMREKANYLPLNWIIFPRSGSIINIITRKSHTQLPNYLHPKLTIARWQTMKHHLFKNTFMRYDSLARRVGSL